MAGIGGTASAGDELFFIKLQQAYDMVQRKMVPKFTSFLDEGQVFLARRYVEQYRLENALFWGGYKDAKRCMLGFFPDYMEPTGDAFPMASFTALYRKADCLSHRDFLGSLMALQIKREAVGDILVSEGSCIMFVTDKVAPLVSGEISKIGRVGVKIEPGITMPILAEEKFQEISGTVASLRLDCMVALLTGKSWEKAGDFIKAGIVSLNYRVEEKGSIPVTAGDILTVRGFGKAKVSAEMNQTKKGRYFVLLQKYV